MSKESVANWLPPLIIAILLVGSVMISGHLSDGPQMVDDNQICKLQMSKNQVKMIQMP